jgi:DNA-binding NarL/FixJ family response regulator
MPARKIFIADDKELACESIKSVLAGANPSYVIHTAQRVEDAIKALKESQEKHEPYGVVIVDLRFDNFEGSDSEKARAGMHVVKYARQIPFLEIIVLTAYPSSETTACALEEGVFSYLAKSDMVDKGTGAQAFFTALVNTVELAFTNRVVMKELDEAIKALEAGVNDIDLLINRAKSYVKSAKKAYDIILETRGKLKSRDRLTEP